MGLIFRKGDKRHAKQFTVLLLVILAIGVWAGLNRRNFLPSEYSTNAAVILAGIFSLVCAFALYRDANPNAPVNRTGAARKALFVLLGSMMAFISGWMATYGVAAVDLKFIAPKSETLASVNFVYPQHEGKGCRYRLKLVFSTPQVEIDPCVSGEIWRSAKQGVRMLAVVASNALGFQYIGLNSNSE